MSSPTTRPEDADGSVATWGRRPVVSVVVRVLAWAIPVVGVFVVLQLVDGFLYSSPGVFGLAVWTFQVLTVALATSRLLERVTRGLLPISLLFNLSLVFPDQAPSRFGVALRRGSPANKQTAENAAAEKAVMLIAELSRHDRQTRGHTERVRAYTDVIAQELGLKESDRAKLAWGALLHDVGKLSVPAAILNKAGALTPDEWATLREHPAASDDLLAPMMDWLGPWGLAAAQHHEYFDGSGYPRGLAGEDISLAGRIVAVADAYDVITSRRSYKQPMTADIAREELTRCSGTQFDPDVVRAFLVASVGERWSAGPLATLPDFGTRLATTGPAATIAVAVTAAFATIFPSAIQPPEQLAFSSTVSVNQAEHDAQDPHDPTIEADTSTVTSTPGTTVATSTSSAWPTSTTTFAGAPPPSTPNAVGTGATPSTGSSTTTTVPTTTVPTTTVPTTSAPPAMGLVLHLTNPGTEETESSATLPLMTSTDLVAVMPAYSSDRSSEPGLVIQPTADSLNSATGDEKQDWVWTAPEAATITGRGVLGIIHRSTAETSETRSGFSYSVLHCSAHCATVTSGRVWSPTDGEWSRTFVGLGELEVPMAAGDTLMLRIVPSADLNNAGLRLAYDAEGFDSTLVVN